MNLDEKRLSGAVFLDVAKSFDTVWVDGLLYQVVVLDFPSLFLKTFSFYLLGRPFKAYFRTATCPFRRMRFGVAYGGIISRRIQSVCQRHAFTFPPCYISLYAGEKTIINTSCQSVLLVNCL
jgi:hypothetical protein